MEVVPLILYFLAGWKIEAEVKLTGILCLGELQPGEVLALHRFSSDFNIHNLVHVPKH